MSNTTLKIRVSYNWEEYKVNDLFIITSEPPISVYDSLIDNNGAELVEKVSEIILNGCVEPSVSSEYCPTYELLVEVTEDLYLTTYNYDRFIHVVGDIKEVDRD